VRITQSSAAKGCCGATARVRCNVCWCCWQTKASRANSKKGEKSSFFKENGLI